MIVHIHQSHPTMKYVLRYNENKVRKGVASVLHTENMRGDGLNNINAAFEIREKMAIRDIEHLSFQLSINPGITDKIPEDRISEFAAELMKRLGYEKQPWVIFKHNDIDRVHYHLVSIRINEKGRKIKDYYEQKDCKKICKSLEKKYGFVYGEDKSAKLENTIKSVMFTPGAANVTASIEACINDSLKYHFTTEKQFAEILKCHGVQVEQGIGKTLKLHLSFQGLDSKGNPCTSSISDTALSIDVVSEIGKRIDDCRVQDCKEQRTQLRTEVSKVLDKSSSWNEFTDRMKSKFVDIIVYKDVQGTPRAITLIDHKTKCAFKSSEVSRSLSFRMLELASRDFKAEERQEQKAESVSEDKDTGITDTLKGFLAAFIPNDLGGGKPLEDYKKPKKKKRKR